MSTLPIHYRPIKALLLLSTLGALCAQTTRSIWDGVYTADQAKRGRAIYVEQCQECHGASLTGGDEASPVSGATFLSNWGGLTVNDLFERIRISMPANKPGTLSRQRNADVLAYILEFNKYPAGSAELPAQTELLKSIRFEATKP